MPALSNLLGRSGRMVFLVLIGLVVIIYIALGFLFMQQGPIRDNLAKQISQMEAVINKPLASMEKLRTDYAKANEVLSAVSPQLILDSVTTAARESGINVDPASGYYSFPSAGASRTTKVGTRNYRVTGFNSITVQGKYSQVMDFIKRLDSGQVPANLVLRKVSVEEVESRVANEDPAGADEYHSVQAALTAMMTGNNLQSVPNPSFPYAGGQATNDMSLFPDKDSEWTGLANRDKTADPQGQPYSSGDKQREEGFNLWDEEDYFWFEGEKFISQGNNLVESGNYLIAGGDRLWEEGDALWDKGSALGEQGKNLMEEGRALMAEGDRRRAEGKKLVAEGEQLIAKGEQLKIKPNNLWADGDSLVVEGNRLVAEGTSLMTEGNRLQIQGDDVWQKGYDIRAEGEDLIAEGDAVWEEGQAMGAGGLELMAKGNRLRAEGEAKVAEGNRLMVQGHVLTAEGDRRTEEGDAMKTEGNTLVEQGHELWEQADETWAASDKPWEEGDKQGYSLFQHDNKADNGRGTLVDYLALPTTSYYYTYDKNGELRQFDVPDIATATEYRYSQVVASTDPEFKATLEVDLYTLAPAAAPKTPSTPAKTPSTTK